MPTALATSKRKFHRLLDSISNASSTSLASNHGWNNLSTTTLPTNLASPAKKPRFESRPTSVYIPPSQRQLTSPRPEPHLRIAIQPEKSPRMNEERRPPNFAPWDRGRFLERLKTYRHVDKWLGKPDKIDEVKWAGHGWSCVGRETVRCVGGCDNVVVIKLEDDVPQLHGGECEGEEEQDEWREEAQKQLVEKYAEMISRAHDEGCLWRRRGCDDTIHRLPLAHQAAALESLWYRYQSLSAMAADLPETLSTPDGLGISKLLESADTIFKERTSNTASNSTSAREPSDASTRAPQPPKNVDRSAFILALFGWQAEEDHITGLATCTACFRRLGLWLFKPSPEDPASQSSMQRLDVIGEHRDYCPWVNALSQNGASRRSPLDGLVGWEVLLRHLKNHAMFKTAETKETNNEAEKEKADTASQVASLISSGIMAEEEKEAVKRNDQERWAKLKRLKQVFQAKKKTVNPKKGTSVR
ncbi:MAG: hypothetical protein Q9163_002530 [Psora crenata]